jgi:hypothetical protein
MTRTYVRRRSNGGAVLLGAIVLVVLIVAAWWVLTYGAPTIGTQPAAQPAAPQATISY